MGIIRKQSIQSSIYLYIGVFIGFLTSSIVFPYILTTEQIGLTATLILYSTVFAQFWTLGFNSVTIRMFSYFRNYENKHNHFFFLVFVVTIVGCIFSVFSYFILEPYIIRINIKNAPLFVKYIHYVLPLIISTLIFYNLDSYYTVLYKTVRGIFLKELVQRILILAALYIYFIKVINFENFIIGYIIAISLPSLMFVILLIMEGEFVIKPKLDFISKDLSKSMINVGLFGILTTLVGSANIQIDKAMASSMMSLAATGIYATVLTFPLLIKVPSRAILKISSAIIADAWKRNDLLEITKIYLTTSINQFVIGLLIFIGIWANADNIFEILGSEFEAGRYVLLFVGLAFVFEMATGASSQIIAYSKHYRYLTWFTAIMLVMVFISNLIFIPLFQITGVALASAITTIAFTLIKVYFLYRKYKIHPFNIKFAYLTCIGLVVYLLSCLMPAMDNFIVDIIIRSGGISFIFMVLIFVMKISPEVNEKIIELKVKYLK